MEIWLNVFELLEYKEHLAKCRLVCQSWRPYVEKIMYKNINLSDWDERRMRTFTRHLAAEPNFCQFIQCITNGHHSISNRSFQHFLELALTLNIKVLDGYWDSASIQITLDVIKFPLDKLVQIPHTKDFNSSYLRMMDLCKDSLQSISFEIQTNTNQQGMALMSNLMGKYKNLTTVVIIAAEGFRGLQDLDAVLANFHHIKELRLKVYEIPTYTNQDQNALEAWLLSDVPKVDTLKALDITYCEHKQLTGEADLWRLAEQQLELRRFGPDWIEYLKYKYPNIDTLDIRNSTYDYKHIALPDFGNLKIFNLTAWGFYTVDTLKDFVRMFERSSNSIHIEYVPGYYGRDIICEMDVSAHLNRAKFTVRIPHEVHPEERTRDLIAALGSVNIKYLIINSTRHRTTCTPNESSVCLVSHLLSALATKCANDISLKITFDYSRCREGRQP